MTAVQTSWRSPSWERQRRGLELAATGCSLSVIWLGGDRWQAVCRCGWESPVVFDRRSAVQAWQQHKNETNAAQRAGENRSRG